MSLRSEESVYLPNVRFIESCCLGVRFEGAKAAPVLQ